MTPFDVANSVVKDMEAAGEIKPATPKRGAQFISIDPFAGNNLKKKETLEKSMLDVLNGPKGSVERLAYETNPNMHGDYSGLYRRKLKLLPDYILKRIAIQDPLVAAIMNGRGNQMSAFGRPQPARDATGYKFEVAPHYTIDMTVEQKDALREQISQLETLLLTCGHTSGVPDSQVPSLSEFLFVQAKNALTFGRIATEVVYKYSAKEGRQFHYFRPLDAGTIYPANKLSSAQEKAEDLRRLERMKKQDPRISISASKAADGEYEWYQVIDDTPMIAFRDDECLVHNFYPTTDVELDGFPVTPMDTVITAITTHLNIASHNKLYFQSGRATRGMLVVQSNDFDQDAVANLKQHFTASINSVTNAWRTPVLKVEQGDSVQWVPIDASGRDMEFQYLSDSNTREILTAFMMSPDELPGTAHLSKGTNSQSLSESSSEFKLEAHRDLGIRPMLSQFQNFINNRILPLLSPQLAKIGSFKLIGLDALSPEKESIRLQQDMAVHMTTNEVLEAVEKKPLEDAFGGNFLLNPQWQMQIDKYVMVGEIMEHFFDKPGASKDPKFQYIRDPFFFQWQQLNLQQQQMEANQQAMQQQAQAQQGAKQEAPNPSDGEEEAKKAQEGHPGGPGNDLSMAMQGAQAGHEEMGKSEHHMTHKQRQLIRKQEDIVKSTMSVFEQEAKEALKDILKVAEQHVKPKKKK